jgi:hypothetical protein
MTDTAQVFSVPTAAVPVVWKDAVEKLRPAVTQSNGRKADVDLLADLLSGDSVLWAVWEGTEPKAYYTTRVATYPNTRAMVLEWIGGSGIKSWMDVAIASMRNHAELNGCSHLEFTGRVGWERLLRDTGWEPEYVCYRMELSDG